MQFLHTDGKNGRDKNFTVAFCFLRNEDEGSYNFTVRQLQKVYAANDIKPFFVDTDKEPALKNALKAIF